MISNSDSSQSSHGGYEPSPQEGQQKAIETKRQQLYMESLRRTEVAPQQAKLVSALSGADSADSSMRQQLARQQEEIARLKASCMQVDGGDAHSHC